MGVGAVILTGTLKGDELGLSIATLFSEPPSPEMLLLLGERSEETSADTETHHHHHD